MKKTTSEKRLSPHDKLFKKSLAHPEAAEHFVRRYMPADVLALVRLHTLKLEQNSFVDDELRASASDVIFSIETAQASKAYLYFLIEHQRRAEKNMPFRLLKYIIRLMDADQVKNKSTALPLVVPFVIYNGESRYPYSMDIFDLFDESVRGKAKEILFNPYFLLDLSQYNTLEIREDPWLSGLLNALKYGPSKKISPRTLVESLHFSLVSLAACGKLPYLEGIIRYINEVQPLEVREELWGVFQEALKPVLGENYMLSIADALRQEGMQQGMQQGMHLKELQIAKNLLASGLGIHFVSQNTGLDIEILKNLNEELSH